MPASNPDVDPRVGFALLVMSGLLIFGFTWALTSGRNSFVRLSHWFKAKRVQRPSSAWIPASMGEAEQGALLLHDIELATERQLLVSFDKVVYVTPRQRRKIARYLRTSHFARGEAAEVFHRYGYQLVTTRR